MHRWKLGDAKNRFSEVVRRATAHEPQLVTKNGRDAVVVLSAKEYERLTTPGGVVEFLRRSPLAELLRDEELDLGRERDFGRDADL